MTLRFRGYNLRGNPRAIALQGLDSIPLLGRLSIRFLRALYCTQTHFRSD